MADVTLPQLGETVTEGTITLELDEGSVEVHAGDMVVQRDTNHAWRNFGDKPVKAIAISVAPSS